MDQIVVGIAILAWIVGTIVNAAKAMKKISSAPPPTNPAIQPLRGRIAQPQTANTGRVASQRPVNINSAQRAATSPTPGSSPNNPLYNDRGAEKRFAQEVDQLIRSEPQPLARNSVSTPSPADVDPNEQVQNRLSKLIVDRPTLLTGIVLAEVLGPPKSKQTRFSR